MKAKKLSIEETIKSYTNENGFNFGLETVIYSLAPEAKYDLTVSGGEFIFDRWESEFDKPSSKEIREEYIRQETIYECLNYLNKKKSIFSFLRNLFIKNES
jgi:hypothetical protein